MESLGEKFQGSESGRGGEGEGEGETLERDVRKEEEEGTSLEEV